MSVIRIHSFIYCTIFLACASTPKITFEDYVDTKSKNIRFQEKKVFSFSESGVYFSNNFKGGRLNSVEQLNDSTFTLSIYPENEPINPSPFYPSYLAPNFCPMNLRLSSNLVCKVFYPS